MKVHGRVLDSKKVAGTFQNVVRTFLLEILEYVKKNPRENILSDEVVKQHNTLGVLYAAISSQNIEEFSDSMFMFRVHRYLDAVDTLDAIKRVFAEGVLSEFIVQKIKEHKTDDVKTLREFTTKDNLLKFLQSLLDKVNNGSYADEIEKIVDLVWDDSTDMLFSIPQKLGIPEEELVYTKYRFFPSLQGIDSPENPASAKEILKKSHQLGVLELKMGQQLSHNITLFDERGSTAEDILKLLQAEQEKIQKMLLSWNNYVERLPEFSSNAGRVIEIDMIPVVLSVKDAESSQLLHSLKSHRVSLRYRGGMVFSGERVKLPFAKKLEKSSRYGFTSRTPFVQEGRRSKAHDSSELKNYKPLNEFDVTDIINYISDTVVQDIKEIEDKVHSPLEGTNVRRYRIRASMFYGLARLTQNIHKTIGKLSQPIDYLEFLLEDYREVFKLSNSLYIAIFLDDEETLDFYKYVIEVSLHEFMAPIALQPGVGPHNVYAFISSGPPVSFESKATSAAL